MAKKKSPQESKVRAPKKPADGSKPTKYSTIARDKWTGGSKFVLLADSEEVQDFLANHRIELTQQYLEANAAMKALAKLLLGDDAYGEITGLGLELYHKRGLVIMPPRYCITVMVARKAITKKSHRGRLAFDPFPASKNKRVKVVPVAFRDYPVKVIEANARYAVVAENAYQAVSPPADPVLVQGGVAISGTTGNHWGTLGIVFRDDAGQKVGLSCAHVVQRGKILQPPKDALPNDRVVGSVTKATRQPSRGVDAACLTFTESAVEGILDLADAGQEIHLLAEEPELQSRWSWLIQHPVWIRGASTQRVVRGTITMPTVHNILIDGDAFRDLMVIHAAPASSTIVAKGDSGAAVLLDWGGKLIWIGLVIGMIDNQQLVACKLPRCLKLCDIPVTRIPKSLRWKIV